MNCSGPWLGIVFEEAEGAGKTTLAPLSQALHREGHSLWNGTKLLQLEGQRKEERWERDPEPQNNREQCEATLNIYNKGCINNCPLSSACNGVDKFGETTMAQSAGTWIVSLNLI